MTSRRQTLAALGGALIAPVPAINAKAEASVAPDRATTDVPLNPRAFGAPLDAQGSDSAGFQAAIDALFARKPFGGTVAVDGGAVRLTTPLRLMHYTTLDFGRAEVQLLPTGPHAIEIGLGDPAFSTTLTGRLLQLQGRGKTAVSVKNGNGFIMSSCDIDLRAEEQTGLTVSANDDPLGPYQGLVDNVRINGMGLAGQVGISLRQKFANGSICVNRWIFNNLRHIASVDVGMDLQGTDGLTINNVNFESCRKSGIRFGFNNRALEARVTRPNGLGGFSSRDLAGMALDAVGAIEVLSGANQGETMVVTTITASGEVLFPSPFPHKFEPGDRFRFTECKCRSVSVLNATYEGGSNEAETAFEFLAGARSCRVHIAMMTLAQGYYFRREIEDLSNTIASRSDVIRATVELPSGSSELWLPASSAGSGSAGYLVHDPSWIDAIFVTAENGNAGSIDVDVVVPGQTPDMIASLTPDNPRYARRIRRALPANSMLGSGMNYQIRVRSRDLRGPERVNIEVLVGIL